MKVVISGASGFIGQALTGALAAREVSDIVALGHTDFLPQNRDRLRRKMEFADEVYNLAGAPILKRWSDAYKKTIYQSRILTTRALVEVINALDRKPSLLISTSAVGYYPTFGEYDERDRVSGKNFLSQVCRDWEEEASQVDSEVRLVITRLGIVIGENGGMIPPLRRLIRCGLGGKIGNGEQPLSWIDLLDLLRIYRFIEETPTLSGVINCVAPYLSTNDTLMHLLAHHYHRILWMRYPKFFFRMLYGEGAMLLTQGQRVRSLILKDSDFRFNFPTLINAVGHL